MSYLVGIESPEFQFLLEERPAHIGRVVQLSSPVVIKDLREDARMSIEEVLVEYRIVVGQRLGQPRQTGGRDLLQRRLVRLVTDTANVDRDAVVGVTHWHNTCSIRSRHANATHSEDVLLTFQFRLEPNYPG